MFKPVLVVYFLFSLPAFCAAQQPRLVLPVGHTDKINSLSYSPDGKNILTASQDSTIKLWDALSGALLTDLKGHTSIVTSAQYAADGKRIVTASGDLSALFNDAIISGDPIAKLWDATTGKLITDVKGHTAAIYAASFSPDGNRLLTASGDSTAKIWDAFSGILLFDLKGHSASVYAALFCPDGKKIVTTASDQTVKLWDITSGKVVIDFKSKASLLPQFSPDGKKMLIASDNQITLWDLNAFNQVLHLKGHTDKIISAQFSADAKKIVTASWDSTAIVWDALTGERIAVIKLNTKSGNSIFSPDGKTILNNSRSTTYIIQPGMESFSIQKTLPKDIYTTKIWDAVSGKLLSILDGRMDENDFSAFSPDGKKIVTLSADNEVKVWESLSGKLLLNLDGNTPSLYAAGFSLDSKKIVSVFRDRFNTVTIWDANSGETLTHLRSHTEMVSGILCSPDGKKILTTPGHLTGLRKEYDNYSGKLWDVTSGKLIASLNGNTDLFWSMQFSPDGNIIVTNSFNDRNIKVWKVSTGELLLSFKGHKNIMTSSEFSADGKKIITASWDGTAKVWEAATGKLLLDLKGHEDNVNTASFSPDGKKIVTAAGNLTFRPQESADNTAKIWDAGSGVLLLHLTGHNAPLYSAEFSADGNTILTISKDSTAKLWNASSGKLLLNLKGVRPSFKAACFSPDGKKIISISLNKTAKLWDIETGKLLHELKGHTEAIRYACFSPNGKLIVTAASYNSAIVWDAFSGQILKKITPEANHYFNGLDWNSERLIYSCNSETILYSFNTGKRLLSFLSIDSSEYIFQLPSKHYLSTQNSAKLLHYVTKDLKVINFEQLDVKYNRPDKVLEAIGNTDTALINSYRKAYEKRIKKLGIDTTTFRDGYSVPEADFENREAIEYEIRNEKLTLHIKANDTTYKLDRYNIWVNEVPVYGQRGISLRNKHSNIFDSSITLKLSQGENRIETSVTNVNGTESYRMPLIVNYMPANKQKENTVFIGIGIDQFADSKYNLQYSAKDIRDLSNKLKEKYKDDIIIDTLFNENVTISNVKALKKKLLQTSENDKVMIAYSGHGMLSKDHDYYLSTYAVNFENPVQAGLPYDELENLLDSIPARKKLLLIDACHSGEVDKEELEKLKANMVAAASDINGAKGVTPLFKPTSKRLGIKNSFELMQQLFVNVGRSTGATVISAAGGTQFALERGDLKNGVFTYSILEFMKDHPTATITALKAYVNKRVPELTKGMQVPTSRTETNTVNWNVW
jgi:WD40 repeat protein